MLACSGHPLLPVGIFYSSVVPFLNLWASSFHFYLFKLVTSSSIVKGFIASFILVFTSSHIFECCEDSACPHSCSFNHRHTLLNVVKILLALIRAHLITLTHCWMLWRFCLPSVVKILLAILRARLLIVTHSCMCEDSACPLLWRFCLPSVVKILLALINAHLSIVTLVINLQAQEFHGMILAPSSLLSVHRIP
jgi:hypothetical protein